MNRNHLIHFERMATTRDAVGQQVRTWTKIGQDWASINPVSGREFFVASGEKATITHTIESSYQSLGLRPSDRIYYPAQSRYFDIKSVINVKELNRDLQFMCIENLHTDDG